MGFRPGPIQLQKMARGSKFRIKEVDGLYEYYSFRKCKNWFSHNAAHIDVMPPPGNSPQRKTSFPFSLPLELSLEKVLSASRFLDALG